MLPEVVIRQCAEEDLPAVRRLQSDWAAEQIVYGYEPASLDALRQALGPYFLIAQQDGHVVGFAAGSVRVSQGTAVIPPQQRYLEIDDVYVIPPLRGQGIGGRLVDTLLRRAKAAGIARCLVYSATKDVRRILDFYEAHGFKSWYVQMFAKL